MILVGRFLRDFVDRLIERQVGIVAAGARVDLVVDVGDVAHIGHVVLAIEMAQETVKNVENDGRTRIADMGIVVDCRPAHIHAHLVRIDGDEVLFGPRERVVDPEAPETVRHPHLPFSTHRHAEAVRYCGHGLLRPSGLGVFLVGKGGRKRPDQR